MVSLSAMRFTRSIEIAWGSILQPQVWICRFTPCQKITMSTETCSERNLLTSSILPSGGRTPNIESSFLRCLFMHLRHFLFRVIGWLLNGTRAVSQTSSVVAPHRGHLQMIFAISASHLPIFRTAQNALAIPVVTSWPVKAAALAAISARFAMVPYGDCHINGIHQ